MEPWEQRAQQPLKNLEKFINKTPPANSTPPQYLHKPQLQEQPQFSPVQPFGGYAITQEQIAQQQQLNIERLATESENPKGGTIALMWKDNTIDPNQIPNEDGFPTYSDVYLSDYTDYNTEEEKIAAVEKYMDLIAKYSAKPNARGSFVIFNGAVISRVATKKVIVY